jgi:1,4-dihydroxy-2-naphthoate octaprenyltransferase
MKSASPHVTVVPNALTAFFLAARPKTWIASVSPVCIGTIMAARIQWGTFVLALLFSLLIQIGTNYANDYFDFVNGADSKLRNGPKRATQEGWVRPASMLIATWLVFALALLIAIPLMAQAGLWSLFLAITCVAFGILYTGGPKPLGYLGLGEPLVFLFFGPVAVCGSYFLQTATCDMAIFAASLAPGFLSCAILIANNLRDEKSDKIAQKWTLVARWGRTFGAWEYTSAIGIAALIPLLLVFVFEAPLIVASTSLILPAAIPWIKKVFTYQDPRELIPVLPGTAMLLLLYTLLFCTTLILGTSL